MRPFYAGSRVASLVAALTLLSPPLVAQEPAAAPTAADSPIVSQEDITRALESKPKTRGLSLRARTEAREMIDLDIPFDFNSSELQPRAVAQLAALEGALKSGSLATHRFRITGHTDAQGKPDYNRALSLRRAQAVQHYLSNHGIDMARLEVDGAGAEHLLKPEAPEDAANRRVEIRNLGESSEARQ